MIPAVQQSREAARRAHCQNNLRQVGIAAHLFHDVNKRLPPGWIGATLAGKHEVFGLTGWGWSAHLLPHLEQKGISDRLAFEYPMLSEINQVSREQEVSLFHCPSDPSTAPLTISFLNQTSLTLPRSNYVANFGAAPLIAAGGFQGTGLKFSGAPFKGPFSHNSGTQLRDFLRGASNTILVGERRSNPTDESTRATWTGFAFGHARFLANVVGTSNKPINDPDDTAFSSSHPGGALFLYADGHVQFWSDTSDHLQFAQASLLDENNAGLVTLLAGGDAVYYPDEPDEEEDEADDPDDEYVPPVSVPPGYFYGPGGDGEALCPICLEPSLEPWPHKPGEDDHLPILRPILRPIRFR
ncbi:DUF1559 domain-containing protein [Blastopirellula retiformator]|uniref:DUF1559 domain-containing protein n=1 Tax=Blastopirellula retiformator TaxID=2527970 RepID=UPI001C98D3F5|nr:DUF1559 domain-containing protein [Blastopirellula retiformator]